VDIYRHPHEKQAASTTVFATLVSNDVRIYTHRISQEILESYPNPDKVLLLYPSQESIPINQLPIKEYDRLVVIDGTWNHAKGMAMRASTLGFVHVKIEARETLFWRFQNIDRTYLSTIEAIYYFFTEYHVRFGCTLTHTGTLTHTDTTTDSPKADYDGRYDNLLFYFKFKWETIQNFYKSNPDKKFTHRHAIADTYIQYS
jgi:DTW domain-containing protein YfiP